MTSIAIVASHMNASAATGTRDFMAVSSRRSWTARTGTSRSNFTKRQNRFLNVLSSQNGNSIAKGRSHTQFLYNCFPFISSSSSCIANFQSKLFSSVVATTTTTNQQNFRSGFQWTVVVLIGGTIAFMSGEMYTTTKSDDGDMLKSDPKLSTVHSSNKGTEGMVPIELQPKFISYPNIPEHDEETRCVYCNWFRPGPCRSYWRSFEYCSKDIKPKKEGDVEATKSNNDDDDDNDALMFRCMEYHELFMTCFLQKRRFYKLVFYNWLQDKFDGMILRYNGSNGNTDDNTVFGCWKDNMVRIDLSEWNAVDLDENDELIVVPNDRAANDRKNGRRPVPLYKRFKVGSDPRIVESYAHIPRRIPSSTPTAKEENGKEKAAEDGNGDDSNNYYVLTEVWVVDQDNMLIGHQFDSKYDQLRVEKQLKIIDKTILDAIYESEAANNNEETEMSKIFKMKTFGVVDDDHFACHFVLLPGITKQVRIFASYVENPLHCVVVDGVADEDVTTTESSSTNADDNNTENDTGNRCVLKQLFMQSKLFSLEQKVHDPFHSLVQNNVDGDLPIERNGRRNRRQGSYVCQCGKTHYF